MNKSNLESEAFESYYGSITEGLNAEKGVALYFNSVMLLRRLAFVLVLIFLQESQGLQLVIITQLSFAMLVVLFHFRPYKENSKNRLEIFNEACLLATCFSFIPFLDEFTLDPKLKLYLGFIPLAISLFFLLTNIGIMLFK